jgi:hypothetical protein
VSLVLVFWITVASACGTALSQTVSTKQDGCEAAPSRLRHKVEVLRTRVFFRRGVYAVAALTSQDQDARDGYLFLLDVNSLWILQGTYFQSHLVAVVTEARNTWGVAYERG